MKIDRPGNTATISTIIFISKMPKKLFLTCYYVFLSRELNAKTVKNQHPWFKAFCIVAVSIFLYLLSFAAILDITFETNLIRPTTRLENYSTALIFGIVLYYILFHIYEASKIEVDYKSYDLSNRKKAIVYFLCGFSAIFFFTVALVKKFYF